MWDFWKIPLKINTSKSIWHWIMELLRYPQLRSIRFIGRFVLHAQRGMTDNRDAQAVQVNDIMLRFA